MIYAGALPADLTAPYDWEELAQRASARLRELIELKLAKARLARGSADQEILGVI